VRVKRRIGSIAKWAGDTYPGRLIAAFGSSQAGNYASGLAFNAFLSMFPLILGLLAILGFATQSSSTSANVLKAILGFFPPDANAALTSAFEGVQEHPGLLGVVSIVGLLWSGSSFFTSMEFSLGMVIGTRQRPFLRQRGMALVMTILFGLSMIITVGVNSLIALPGLGWLFEPIVGLIVWYAFMLAVYRLVPNRTYRIRDMWPGILIAGTAMEALTLLWPVYAHLAHGFSTYGSVLGLFFVLASWLYFLAEFILLGAVANRLHCGDPETRGLLAARDRGRAPVASGSQPDGGVSGTGL
jgi:membrane protein